MSIPTSLSVLRSYAVCPQIKGISLTCVDVICGWPIGSVEAPPPDRGDAAAAAAFDPVFLFFLFFLIFFAFPSFPPPLNARRAAILEMQ